MGAAAWASLLQMLLERRSRFYIPSVTKGAFGSTAKAGPRLWRSQSSAKNCCTLTQILHQLCCSAGSATGLPFPALSSALYPASETKLKKRNRDKLMLIRIAFSSDDFSAKQSFPGKSVALIFFPFCLPSLTSHYAALTQESWHISNIRCP